MKPTSRWDFKLSGTYEAPYGIRVSPLVRHQAGANFARQFVVGAGSATAAGAIFSGTVNVELFLNSRRHDNITVFDVRADRGFNSDGRHARGRLFVDLFNITNTNAAETRTITSGTAFLRPTAVLAPRTARIGARLSLLEKKRRTEEQKKNSKKGRYRTGCRPFLFPLIRYVR